MTYVPHMSRIQVLKSDVPHMTRPLSLLCSRIPPSDVHVLYVPHMTGSFIISSEIGSRKPLGAGVRGGAWRVVADSGY